MANIVFIGGGIVGLCGAMMLGEDGHRVTVLERDPAPPPEPSEAWSYWERPSVSQFRLLHGFMPRFRQVLDDQLPGLTDALIAGGAYSWNFAADLPPDLTGGRQEGDERFQTITGRRPLMEAAVARFAAKSNVTIERGVTVRGLLGEPGRSPRITGVHTDDGRSFAADLVVDASGRYTSVPRMLRNLGSPGPTEERENYGHVYYGRHFRSASGAHPPVVGPMLQQYGSITIVAAPADLGTWGVVVMTLGGDAPLRKLRDESVWRRVVQSFPLAAPWLDGEPLDEVAVMANIEDRERGYVVGGRPVATGIVPLADAWACSNPSRGRGATIGVLHAAALRDLVRETSVDDHEKVAVRWHDLTQERVAPFLRETIAADRHRTAEMRAHVNGQCYHTEDRAWTLMQSLSSASRKDPSLFRELLDIVAVNKLGSDVFARPGIVSRVTELADGSALPGPDRAQLLELIDA